MNTLRNNWSSRVRLPLTAGCYIAGLGLATTWEHNRPHQLWLDVLAIGLVLCGVGVRLWAIATIANRSGKTVTDVGLYSVTRNPLDWGTLLIVLAQCFAWQSVSLAVMSLVPVTLYLYGVVPAEERLLRARFGEAYDHYRSRVPRWWPLWSAYVRDESLNFRTAGFRKEVRLDLCWITLTAIACWYASIANS